MKIAGTSIDDPAAMPSYSLTLPVPPSRTPAPKIYVGGEEWKTGKQVKSDGQRMFAAAMVSRLTADWPISISSANAEILISAIATRSRMRQLERDDDYMRRMLRLFQNNIIGHQGIMLMMKMKDPSAPAKSPVNPDPTKPPPKPKPQYDTEGNAMVQNAWKKYLRRENCTVSRNMSGVQLQRLVVRCVKRDGAIMLRRYRGFKNDFRYAVQPLEIDYLNFYNCGRAENGNLIQFGIEYDEFQAPAAYYILSRHPGDVLSPFENYRAYQTRVPAEDIFILFDVDRANQLIGMSDFCSIATRLHALGKYEEAEAVAARMAACKGGFIKKTVPTEYTGPTDARGNAIEEMSPGMVEQGEPGEEWTDIDPKHPMEAYNGFVRGMLRGAAAGGGLGYNTVANDLENVNYSSLKAGRLEETAQYQYDQTMIIEQLMQPWFDDWLPFAILTGEIQMPITKVKKIQDGVNWQPRIWQSVEPFKETQSDLLEIEGKLASRREKIAERGRNIDDVDEELEEDNASAAAHGLPNENIQLPTIKKGTVPDPDDDKNPPQPGQ